MRTYKNTYVRWVCSGHNGKGADSYPNAITADEDDLISSQELNDKIGGSRKEIERLENELKMVSYHLIKGEQLESVLNHTFNGIEDITDVCEMTNAQLKRIIQKMEVDKEGNVEIFLHLFGNLGFEEAVCMECKIVENMYRTFERIAIELLDVFFEIFDCVMKRLIV